ncbi:MFS transporter [Sphingomonas sp.]|uniref:MFS transporter n=1 Tax=Sphingomonas sp. TaxID=28214 RepID=UPI003B3AE244
MKVVPTTRPERLRWVILALLFLATVLNYVDRQTLSILASYVQHDLRISDRSYAHIVQAFLIAYTAAYLLAGWVTDRLGAKVALALFLGWWSLANMATGWVRSALELGLVRAMLGLGEPGVYTAGPKAVQEHFPPHERGFAFGAFTAGAMVGATLAPPLIGGLALTMGWRTAFVVSGAAGFVWLVAWLLLYRDAAHSKETEPRVPVRWGPILRDRRVWGLAASRMLSDPVWYFYLFWFPKYLTDARGMTLMAVAKIAWVVYLAADLGSIGGGWFSGQLIRRGISPERSRLIAMTIAACLSPFGLLIAFHPSIGATLALGALVAFAHLVLQINISTLIIDLYPKAVVATVFGVIAAGSGLGGILSTQIVGQLVSGGSFDTVFLIMAALHPASCAVAWIACRRPRTQAETV